METILDNSEPPPVTRNSRNTLDLLCTLQVAELHSACNKYRSRVVLTPAHHIHLSASQTGYWVRS
jgi:hypothetical protein